MTQPFFRVLQNLARWLLAVCWTGMTLLATTVLFFGNFVVAWQAFVLLGFEQEPLFNIPLIGPMATAVGVGDAQLAALYAAVLTAAMVATVIGTFKLGNEALTLYFDLRQAQSAGNADTTAGMIKLIEAAAGFVILAIFAVAVARYDVSLFNIRLQALLTGQEVEEALTWLPDEAARLGEFLADFAARARWGYLAIIGGVAFVTEKAFQRASERWLVLGQTIDTAIAGAPANNVPAAAGPGPDTVAAPTAAPPEVAAPPVEEATATGTPNATGAAAQAPNATAEHRTRPAAGTQGPVPPPPRPADPMTAPPPPAGPTVQVVWGPGEVREMPLAEVERDQQQYVRDGAGRAWFRRAYYEQIGATESDVESPPQQTEEEPSHA